VQGLLSAIETAYGNEVIASIDDSGHIVVTDKYVGESQVSISFDYTQTQSDDIFGSVLTSNAGGQEGRYVMEITASNDGSNHLTLAHDNYGSSYSFTVSEDRNNGLWDDSQSDPVEVNNGQDVAGTINGEAATGSGQILTGNDDEANVDGLIVKYTGATTGAVGTVTLTLGTAELFDRTLFNMTDDYEGYVAFKQDSLRDSINDFDGQIKEMEARLDRKMETMINRFVAMEVTLSKIKTQSEWLNGQINATYSGWWW
jgi:flagellar hook-associated protein 2